MICFGMPNKWRMVLFSELARHSVKAGNTLLLSFVNWGNMFVKQQSKRKNYMDSCELSVFFFVLFFARGRKAKSNAMSNLHGWSILRIFYYLMLGLWKEQNISNKILIPPPFGSVLACCLKPVADELCNHVPPMPSESMELCNYFNLRMCSLCGIGALEVSFEKHCWLPGMFL